MTNGVSMHLRTRLLIEIAFLAHSEIYTRVDVCVC